MAASGIAPPMVSFYHRVADVHPNAWTISTEQFDRHLDYYARHFDTIDLAQVQRRVIEGNSNRPSVSITFDDGYAENQRHALPAMIARGIPVTYFVSTAHVEHARAFSHDLNAGRPLPINSKSSLRTLSDSGVEIGGHTADHADLSKIYDAESLRTQIIDDRARLQDIIGREVRYFAFPFGLKPQLHAAAIEAVIQAGYHGFCSAFGGYNLIGGDAFHIRRFHGDPEFSRLVNWLSLDRGKFSCEPTLEFQRSNRDVIKQLDAPESSKRRAVPLQDRGNESVSAGQPDTPTRQKPRPIPAHAFGAAGAKAGTPMSTSTNL